MKRFLTLLGVCLVLLLLIDLIAGMVAPDQLAVDAALNRCGEQGWQPSELSLLQSKISGGLLGKDAVVEFQSKDRKEPKHVRVTLRKPVNLMGWQIVDYEEEAKASRTPTEDGMQKDDRDNPIVKEAKADTEAILNDLLGGKYDNDPNLAPVARKVKGFQSWSIESQKKDPDDPKAVSFGGTLKGTNGEATFMASMRKQQDGKWMIGYFQGPNPK